MVETSVFLAGQDDRGGSDILRYRVAGLAAPVAVDQCGGPIPPVGRQDSPDPTFADPQKFGRLSSGQSIFHHTVEHLESCLLSLVQCHVLHGRTFSLSNLCGRYRRAITAVPTLDSTATATVTTIVTATHTPAPTQPPTLPSSTWREITVAPEDPCSDYDPDDYRYSPSLEPRIVDAQGDIYGPYTGTWFDSIKETDIEHIVARSEAYNSGLCAADPATRSEFASDLLNLTLASPSVNRHRKSDKDPAEWLPDLNQCWYVDRVEQVRRRYGLTIDRAEADAIDKIIAGCRSTEMVILVQGTLGTGTATPTSAAPATPTPSQNIDALALRDDNANGRISCSEARAHGIAPVQRDHPAHQFMRDADGDGVVCE